MKSKFMIDSVRREVEKPFQEKLEHAQKIIKAWATHPWNKDKETTVVSCSFGKDSMIVLYYALKFNPNIPVVFENTGIEYPETLKLARQLRDEWKLNYVELHPAKGVTFWTINDRIRNEHLFRDDGVKKSNLCCYHLKERPFHVWRKGAGITHSFTGMTAVESRNRMFTACSKGQEYFSKREGLFKIHPILYFTEEEVWKLTRELSLPVNECYKKYCMDRTGCMWCMSHKFWREQIAKLNPRVYNYIMRRYYNSPTLLEAWEKKIEKAEDDDGDVANEDGTLE